MKIDNFHKIIKKIKLPLSKIKKIELILKPHGGEIFMIGGVVRDIIKNKLVSSNTDLVTSIPINLVTKLLKKNKIKFSSEGFSYGSIVIHDGNHSFDLTSMRKDIETYGRKAKVKFSSRIDDDSKRRDFTINSIYCDTRGQLLDPNNGLKDLTNYKYPRVKFIGSAEKRINEDYLRILRFLRFSLYYSRIFYSPHFEWCKKLKKNIIYLSFERRINELKKILILINFESKVIIEQTFKFIETSIGCKIKIENFLSLCKLERTIEDISFERRIKFLTRKVKSREKKFVKFLEKKTKERILLEIKIFDFSSNNIIYLLYKYEKIYLQDALIFAYLDKEIKKKKLLQLLDLIGKFKIKKIPIDGTDLQCIGFKKGKRIGKVLDEIKFWWIDNNFRPTKKQCMEFAKKLLPTSFRR